MNTLRVRENAVFGARGGDMSPHTCLRASVRRCGAAESSCQTRGTTRAMSTGFWCTTTCSLHNRCAGDTRRAAGDVARRVTGQMRAWSSTKRTSSGTRSGGCRITRRSSFGMAATSARRGRAPARGPVGPLPLPTGMRARPGCHRHSHWNLRDVCSHRGRVGRLVARALAVMPGYGLGAWREHVIVPAKRVAERADSAGLAAGSD